MKEAKNLGSLNVSPMKSVSKNHVIKNVAYVTQVVGENLVTFELCPPRSLKVTNQATRTKRKGTK